MLIITADHGCDPTDVSTDHTREYVPLLVYYGARKEGVDLGIRTSFTDIGQTLADVFGVAKMKNGTSFLPQIRVD